MDRGAALSLLGQVQDEGSVLVLHDPRRSGAGAGYEEAHGARCGADG